MTQVYFSRGMVVPGDKVNETAGGWELLYQRTITFPTNVLRSSITLKNLEYKVNTEINAGPKEPNWIEYTIENQNISGKELYFIIRVVFATNTLSIFGNGYNDPSLPNGKSVDLSYSVVAVCADPTPSS